MLDAFLGEIIILISILVLGVLHIKLFVRHSPYINP